METLANLEMLRSQRQAGGFSAAARLLGLTPAAVSRNVAMLERNLGLRLFHRSTRKLNLTRSRRAFLHDIGGNLEALQDADCRASSGGSEPAGVLKLSLSPNVRHRLSPASAAGISHALSAHPPGMAFREPAVDLVAEGYDAAIGGGFDLSPGVVSAIAGARPRHRRRLACLSRPDEHRRPILPALPPSIGILMRSLEDRPHPSLDDAGCAGNEMAGSPRETIVVNDPAAMRQAALLGLWRTMIAVPDALATS